MTRARSGLTVLVAVIVAPAVLAAQEEPDPELLARCSTPAVKPELGGLCRDVVVGLQLLQPELGLGLVGGNPVLGTASPIGHRFRFLPRAHLGGRISFVWVDIPNVLQPPTDPSQRVGRTGFTVAVPQLDISVGVFDGLELGTTLEGFGSVELLGSWSAITLPAEDGFENDVTGYGVGARIGLLREGFTVPGISVSLFHKWFGRVRLGDFQEDERAQMGIDLRALSFRGGLSKRFVAVGVALTLGYDSFSSDVDFSLRDPGQIPGAEVAVVSAANPFDLDSERFSAFLDLSYVTLFVNFVAELGWQEEQKLLTSTGDEVESGNLLAAIGIRFTL